jgi:hypothetical protein
VTLAYQRFIEIWALRGPHNDVSRALTPEEDAYISARWQTMPGERCWMDAFFALWREATDAFLVDVRERVFGASTWMRDHTDMDELRTNFAAHDGDLRGWLATELAVEASTLDRMTGSGADYAGVLAGLMDRINAFLASLRLAPIATGWSAR